MQPIEEYGKGKGHAYGHKIKRSGLPYTVPDHIYYGRGYMQLTWYENYKYLGLLIGKDLLNHPELALLPEIAAKIMGMTKAVSPMLSWTPILTIIGRMPKTPAGSSTELMPRNNSRLLQYIL